MTRTEYITYITILVSLVFVLFITFFEETAGGHTCALGYNDAIKYGNLGPKTGLVSSLNYSKALTFGFIYSVPYFIFIILCVITYYLKYLLNHGIIDLPKKVFIAISIVPSLLIITDYFGVKNNPNKVIQAGYIAYLLLILIGNLVILLQLKNAYVTINGLVNHSDQSLAAQNKEFRLSNIFIGLGIGLPIVIDYFWPAIDRTLLINYPLSDFYLPQMPNHEGVILTIVLISIGIFYAILYYRKTKDHFILFIIIPFILYVFRLIYLQFIKGYFLFT